MCCSDNFVHLNQMIDRRVVPFVHREFTFQVQSYTTGIVTVRGSRVLIKKNSPTSYTRYTTSVHSIYLIHLTASAVETEWSIAHRTFWICVDNLIGTHNPCVWKVIYHASQQYDRPTSLFSSSSSHWDGSMMMANILQLVQGFV